LVVVAAVAGENEVGRFSAKRAKGASTSSSPGRMWSKMPRPKTKKPPLIRNGVSSTGRMPSTVPSASCSTTWKLELGRVAGKAPTEPRPRASSIRSGKG